MALVTLLTDFGTADGYVGAMKGVILRDAPGTTIVDIAHDVPRHDVAHAAWVLATTAPEFPDGTIHVCVVDPGVGGARAEVIVRGGEHVYVGPDNGVFAYLAVDAAWSITAASFRAATVSKTFHGRDVFARTAAALVRGLRPHHAGPPVTLAGARRWPPGCVVHVDRYGNLVTDVVCAAGGRGAVTIRGKSIGVADTFEDVAVGALVAYRGSAGTLEIAVRDGDAARLLAVQRGEPVALA
jgi:hypothetical protein